MTASPSVQPSSRHLFCFFVVLPFLSQAFLPNPTFSQKNQQAFLLQPQLSSNNDNNDPARELTSTLARLDRQWKSQQITRKSESRWKAFPLDDPNKIAYWLTPPNQSIPSCVLVFVGGAGLGTYPQIAYSELLVRLSDRLNAACLTVPYEVGLDHFALAQTVGEDIRAALDLAREQNFILPESPVYCLAHSLGAKLMTIHMAATQEDFDGMGWISFNNFGFGQTIGMAKEFAKKIQNGMMGEDPARTTSTVGESSMDEIFNQVFDFAESAVSAMGFDFVPNPVQMSQLIGMKYQTNWRNKTRLFTFDQDALQNTQEFCEQAYVDVSELTGTHLTPVYFSMGIDDLPDEEAQDMARDAMGGIEKVSFGDEGELNALVDEVTSWVLGKGPSQRPEWQRERPLLEGSPSS